MRRAGWTRRGQAGHGACVTETHLPRMGSAGAKAQVHCASTTDAFPGGPPPAGESTLAEDEDEEEEEGPAGDAVDRAGACGATLAAGGVAAGHGPHRLLHPRRLAGPDASQRLLLRCPDWSPFDIHFLLDAGGPGGPAGRPDSQPAGSVGGSDDGGAAAPRKTSRQRQLEEALLLQMEMQKKLHEQLEVGWPGPGAGCVCGPATLPAGAHPWRARWGTLRVPGGPS